MSLSKKAIDEFKEIYKKEYKKELNDAEASEVANNLVGLFKILYDCEVKEQQRKHRLKKEDEIFMGNYVVSFGGKSYDLKGVVQGCMHIWKKFFEEKDLLLPRGTPYNIK